MDHLPHELAVGLAKGHQDALVARDLRIAQPFVIRADEDHTAGDDYVAVTLRAQLGHSPEPGSEAETAGPRAQTAAMSSVRKMIATDFVLLILICLRTPLCCRNRVPRGRCRIFRARLVDSESDRCVQSSTRRVQVRSPARLCRARVWCRQEDLRLPVSDGTRCRASRRTAYSSFAGSQVATDRDAASGCCQTESGRSAARSHPHHLVDDVSGLH